MTTNAPRPPAVRWHRGLIHEITSCAEAANRDSNFVPLHVHPDGSHLVDRTGDEQHLAIPPGERVVGCPGAGGNFQDVGQRSLVWPYPASRKASRSPAFQVAAYSRTIRARLVSSCASASKPSMSVRAKNAIRGALIVKILELEDGQGQERHETTVVSDFG